MTIKYSGQTEIGRILEIRRKGCYLSCGKLSEKTGVHKKTINYIERGITKKPHDSTIEILMAALDEEENRIKKIKEEVGLV